MTFNPYTILSILPDATTEQIHAAYRKLAMTLHPDHGGGAEAFAELSRAHDILMDAEKRRKYDEMGISTDDGDAVVNELNTLFVKLMSEINVDKIAQTDIIGTMQKEINKKLSEAIRNLADLNKTQEIQQKGLSTIRKRMKARKQNFLLAALEAALAKILVPIKQLEDNIVLFKGMLALLGDFEYEFDVVEPSGMAGYFIGVPRIYSTTGGFVND